MSYDFNADDVFEMAEQIERNGAVFYRQAAADIKDPDAKHFLSDLAVARQRFLRTGFVDRLWGLPLYYGAQLVFASTVG